MKRFLNPALVAIAAIATLGLAACGSTTAASTDDTVTTADGTDDVALADTATSTDTTTGTDAVAADVPCGGKCTATQTCTANACVDIPCGGPCATAGDQCNKTTNKCFTPCGGPCAAGSTCDLTTPPGTCKAYTAPTSWGINGDDKIQHVVKLAISAKASSCDLVDATGKLGATDGVGDNALAGAASLIGTNLQDAVTKGTVALLFEPKTYKTDGTSFTFNVLIGNVDPADTTHKPVDVGAKFTVKPASYDLTKCDATGCPSLVTFTTAAIKAGVLDAKSAKFFLSLNISSIALALTIYDVDFSGPTTDSSSWVATTGGRLCGYITVTDLNATIDALPASTLAQFGGAAAVKKLLPTLIKPDVSTNGDGVKDAMSLSLDIDTLGGVITGMGAN